MELLKGTVNMFLNHEIVELVKTPLFCCYDSFLCVCVCFERGAV
jgi:hypothetical protein